MVSCNLCGATGSRLFCSKCKHELCSDAVSGLLTTRTYDWLRRNSGLKDGIMFDPIYFFSLLMEESRYRGLPRYVQEDLVNLVENSVGSFGRVLTVRSASALQDFTDYMVIRGGSGLVHFGAVLTFVPGSDSNGDSFLLCQAGSDFVLKPDDVLKEPLVCVRVSSENHYLPDVSVLFD